MHRRGLLDMLARHRPFDDRETESLRRIIEFVQGQPDCFERFSAEGHITGSAWLLDRAGERALLTFHRKLRLWLQPGGHADGDPDVLAVAIREAREESGVQHIAPVDTAVFDVDVHRIPARPGEPAHFHYDVRFLLRVDGDERIRISEESLDLRWFAAEEIDALNTDESVRRMCRKWTAQRAAAGSAAAEPVCRQTQTGPRS